MTANFSSYQNSGSLTTATFTDTTTSETGVTGRALYIRKYNGSYLVPSGTTTDYVFWPVVAGAGDTIDVDILDKDYCVDVTMVLYSGSSIAQSVTILTLFTGYGDLFLRQLTQYLAANKAQISAKNFWNNKVKLRTLLDDAAQAVSLLNDQTIAQFCLDEEKKLTDNISLFFN